MFATCSADTADAFSYGAPYGGPKHATSNVVIVLQTTIPELIETIYHNYVGRTSTFSVRPASAGQKSVRKNLSPVCM